MPGRSKFKGKIRDNPLVALERGNREVMLSIWQEYLQELLDLDPASGRRRLLLERIEGEGGFLDLYKDWNDLPAEQRAARWLQLVRTAKAVVAETAASCLRCGDCCERSSPTLVEEDLPLLQEETLHWTEIITLRVGERAYDPRQRQVITLTAERLKLREQPQSHRCLFFAADPNRCLIYDHRPQQCRVQFCYQKPDQQPPSGRPLTRQAIFGAHPEIWQLIATHEERCGIPRLAAVLDRLREGEAAAEEELFDILHFDHYLRDYLRREWQLPTRALDFLLGRSLPEILPQFGLKATLTPEGTFKVALAEKA